VFAILSRSWLFPVLGSAAHAARVNLDNERALHARHRDELVAGMRRVEENWRKE
jgi:hypothetical protein